MATQNKLGRYSKLPAPEAMVHDLAGLAGDDNVSFHKVAQVVQQDPGISASLIRLSNSAFFSNPSPVIDLLTAVRVIGLDLSMAAAIGAALSNQIGTLGATKAAYRQAWYEGILRAHVARRIARKVCPNLSGQAYLVGLFLEVGQLGFLASVRNYDVMLSAWAQLPNRLLEVETETFGVTHQDVQERILKNWELPSSLADALAGAPPSAERATSDAERLAQIAHVLRCASVSKARGTGVVDPTIGEFLASAFSLDATTFDAILSDSAKEVSSMRRLFGSSIPRGARIVADLAELQKELLDCRESRLWLRGASILIVSDDDDQVAAMQEMLGHLGASSENVASSVSEAVETAKDIRANMIFLQRPAQQCTPKAQSEERCKRTFLRAPVSVHCTHRELGMALLGGVDVSKQECLDEASLWRRIHTLRLHRYRQPSLQ